MHLLPEQHYSHLWESERQARKIWGPRHQQESPEAAHQTMSDVKRPRGRPVTRILPMPGTVEYTEGCPGCKGDGYYHKVPHTRFANRFRTCCLTNISVSIFCSGCWTGCCAAAGTRGRARRRHGTGKVGHLQLLAATWCRKVTQGGAGGTLTVPKKTRARRGGGTEEQEREEETRHPSTSRRRTLWPHRKS